MRKTLILIFSLFGISQAVAQTATDFDGLAKVAYCYGALTKWQMLHPLPAECTQPNANSAICQTGAKDARKIDQFIAYLSQRMLISRATFNAYESAQEKGEADATNCKEANPGMIEPNCPRIAACLTMDPPQ
jgi:hypothetical protein